MSHARVFRTAIMPCWACHGTGSVLNCAWVPIDCPVCADREKQRKLKAKRKGRENP